MSDIKVGDLVVVVRGMTCCGASTGNEGAIFQVTELRETVGRCLKCKSTHNPGAAHSKEIPNGVDIDRLRRIPPLAELSEAERKQQEPA